MSDEDWAEQIANEAAMPIIRSMYPSRSRGEMKNEFRHFLLTGIQYARSQERSRREKLWTALDKIRCMDRNITGMGSTSGDSKSWWLYGPYGEIARQALAADDEEEKE